VGEVDPDGCNPVGVGVLKFGGGIVARRLLGTAAVTEGSGLAADSTIFGAPAGLVLNILGGAIGAAGAIWATYDYLHQAKGKEQCPPSPPKDYLGNSQLPLTGDNPYVPPKNWKPTLPLPKAAGGKGYEDDSGNIWAKGPPHHFPDQPWEWDVTDPKTGTHINVGQDGTVR